MFQKADFCGAKYTINSKYHTLYIDAYNLDCQKCHIWFLMFLFQVKEMLYCGYASRLCGAWGPVPEKTHGQEQIKWYVFIFKRQQE